MKQVYERSLWNKFTKNVDETSCSVSEVGNFFQLVFLSHLSNYIIAMIAVDCYVRIKNYVNFKTLLTTKAVLKLMWVAFCLALFKGFLVTTGMLLVCCYVYLYDIGRYYNKYDNSPSSQNYLDIRRCV